jgi:hypothetical protein
MVKLLGAPLYKELTGSTTKSSNFPVPPVGEVGQLAIYMGLSANFMIALMDYRNTANFEPDFSV